MKIGFPDNCQPNAWNEAIPIIYGNDDVWAVDLTDQSEGDPLSKVGAKNQNHAQNQILFRDEKRTIQNDVLPMTENTSRIIAAVIELDLQIEKYLHLHTDVGKIESIK